jgi:hypothetical protein
MEHRSSTCREHEECVNASLAVAGREFEVAAELRDLDAAALQALLEERKAAHREAAVRLEVARQQRSLGSGS